MRHQLVLQLDRRDPLAAGLDEVLRAVDEAHLAALVHRRHVARAQPAVVGEALGGARVVVVGRGDPVAAGLQLAARRAVARRRAPACRGRRRAARRRARPGPARRAARPARSWGSSCWSPSRRATDTTGLVSVIPHACRIGSPSVSRNASDSAFGHGRAAARDRPQRRGVAALQLGQRLHPDRRHAGRHGDPLLDDEVGDRLARQVRPGHDQVGAGGDAGVGEAPRVGVEHRHDRQHAVGLADADGVRGHRAHRVQERAAVGVDDALRVARGAARVAHAGGAVLVVDAELDRRRRRRAAPRSRAACGRAGRRAPRPCRRPSARGGARARTSAAAGRAGRAASGRRRSPRRRRG